MRVADSLKVKKNCKRAESTINHHGNRKTKERTLHYKTVNIVRAGSLEIPHYVAKNLQVLQKIHRYCRKSAGVVENPQVLQKICRGLQKICRVLQKIYRYCRKSAGTAENLQSVAENL